MPTARELLEQADALMRRNRAREDAPAAPLPADEAIPDLTEEPVEVQPAAMAVAPAEPLPPREALARELWEPPSASYPPPASSTVVVTLDDIPELTDVVEEIEAPSMLDIAGDFDLGEPSVFMESGHGEVSIVGPWPAPPRATLSAHAEGLEAPDAEARARGDVEIGILHVSPECLDDDAVGGLPVDAQADPGDAIGVDDDVAADATWPAQGFTPGDVDTPAPAMVPIADDARVGESPLASATDGAEVPLPPASNAEVFSEPGTPLSEPVAEAGDAAGDAAAGRWDQIAEEIRMQVLQRIDIYTDTGLQEQLAQRLQPIVDSASADLVSTINQHVGQLLRAYVAEAIEREIEQWRADHRP
jgi:hypothetical protein